MRRSLDGWTEELAGRARAGPGLAPARQSRPGGREAYLVARAAHDGGEDGPGRVIPREAGLH